MNIKGVSPTKLAFSSPWRWHTCTETCWRYAFNIYLLLILLLALQPTVGFSLLGDFLLPEDDTLVPKHVGDTPLIFIFFLFFYWRYNPLWVLAFSVIFFHSALSSHCFLHRLTPIICKSSSMPAIHVFLGLPLVLVPIGFHCNILLGVLLSSIRITWPSQAILLLFINLTISAFFIRSFTFNICTYIINP